MKNIIKKYLIVLSGALLLFGCGGTSSSPGSNNTPNPSGYQLSIVGPYIYPSMTVTNIPVTVTNRGSSTYTNLAFTISNNNTQGNLTITPDSASSCTTLAPAQSCILLVAESADAQPGSFSVTLVNGLQGTSSTMPAATIGLANLPINNESGINGVNIYYTNTVSLPDDNAGTAIVTMVVNSANAGAFNTFDLLDASGNSIPYTILTGNSGNGLTSLAQGSVVSLAVTIPPGSTSLIFYPALKQNGTLVSGSTTADTINVLRPSSPKQAAVQIVPDYFALNGSESTQVVTITNNGTAAATSLSPQALSAPMTILSSTCGSSLAIGANCSYTIGLDITSSLAGTTFFVLNYNNGLAAASQTTHFTYQGSNAYADLLISGTNNPNLDFSSTTNNPVESSIVTLLNNGAVPITLSGYNPVQYFNLQSGGNAPCSVGQTLQPGAFCTANLVYTNSTLTNGEINTQPSLVSYSYPNLLDPTITESGSSSVGLTYQTTQSQASLSLSPTTVNFGNVLNNNSASSLQSITITNQGDLATTPNVTVSGTNYSIIQNCTASLAPGQSCTVNLKFGPIPSSTAAGSKSGSITVTYVPYPSGTASSLTAALSTQVVTAKSAIINVTQTGATGFSGGSGTQESQYWIQAGNTGTVTYTITNTGLVPANNFTLSSPPDQGSSDSLPSITTSSLSDFTAPPGWTITNNTCGSTLAASGGSCSITYTVLLNTATATLLSTGAVQMAWVDEDSPNGETQLFGTSDVYVSTYAAPSISVSPTTVSLGLGVSKTVTATLTGGYNVTNQTVSIDATSSGGAILPISSCSLSATVPSCVLTITTSSNAVLGSYSLPISNSGSASITPSTLQVSISQAWVYVGLPGFSAGVADYTSLAINESGVPYVAYEDYSNSGKATVMMYNGSSWVNVGNPGFSAGPAQFTSLAINESGVPYVAYQDVSNSNKATVMMYNGSSWVNVGQPGFSAGQAGYSSLAINASGVPYVAYQDYSNSQKATVMMYNGSNWESVGQPGFSAGQADYTSLAINESGVPYVAYQDYSNSGKATVMMYNGSNWESVGQPGFSAGAAQYTSLAINASGVPYVAYRDSGNRSKATVMMYNGSNWVNVGQPGFSAGIVFQTSLAINASSVPYVAYTDVASRYKATVMMYNGSSWVNVGQPGFSADEAAYASLVINESGVPYVAYKDGGNSSKASVQYFQ